MEEAQSEFLPAMEGDYDARFPSPLRDIDGNQFSKLVLDRIYTECCCDSEGPVQSGEALRAIDEWMRREIHFALEYARQKNFFDSHADKAYEKIKHLIVTLATDRAIRLFRSWNISHCSTILHNKHWAQQLCALIPEEFGDDTTVRTQSSPQENGTEVRLPDHILLRGESTRQPFHLYISPRERALMMKAIQLEYTFEFCNTGDQEHMNVYDSRGKYVGCVVIITRDPRCLRESLRKEYATRLSSCLA